MKHSQVITSNKDLSNVVLLLAGGVGERAKEDIPKQFVKIKDKPLIIYTLEKFENNENIDGICIVCHKDWITYLWEEIDRFHLSKVFLIVEGGNSGLASAYNGICKIRDMVKGDPLVLIHDAVRPFVDQESINDNIKVAKEHGLAMCAAPLVETLAYSEDGLFSGKVVDRDHLYRILTPQTFSLSILEELFEDKDVLKTNEPSAFALYMKKGYPIYLSKGNEKNIKITYPEDIEYFKKFFE